MRKALYSILSSAPAFVVSNAIGIGGICATLWPEQIKLWTEWLLSTGQIRLLGFAAVAVAVCYLIVLRLIRPTDRPEATSTQTNVTYGDRSPIFSNNTGATFNIAPEEKRKPATTLIMRAHSLRYPYADGVERCGIQWRSGFAHVQLQFLNRAETAFENVSVYIRLDFPIAVGSATSELTDVRIAAAFRSGGPVVVGDTGDGILKVVASDSPNSGNQYLDPVYRLFCANMPAKSDICVDLAVAQYGDISQVGQIYLSTPPTPTIVQLDAEYVAYGERRTEMHEIAL